MHSIDERERAQTHTYTHVHTHIHTHTCTHVDKHTHIHTCMHIYVHACTHTQTHTHTQVSNKSRTKVKLQINSCHVIINLVHWSFQAWRKLKQVAEMMEIKVWKPTNLAGTRWLPHIEKALTAVLKNFQPLMTHLQHASEAASASADMTGRAKQSSWDSCSLFIWFLTFSGHWASMNIQLIEWTYSSWC